MFLMELRQRNSEHHALFRQLKLECAGDAATLRLLNEFERKNRVSFDGIAECLQPKAHNRGLDDDSDRELAERTKTLAYELLGTTINGRELAPVNQKSLYRRDPGQPRAPR